MKKANSMMVLPVSDLHGVVAVAVNSSVRNATISLNRCKILDSKHELDKGAARFAGKSLGKNGRRRMESQISIAKGDRKTHE